MLNKIGANKEGMQTTTGYDSRGQGEIDDTETTASIETERRFHASLPQNLYIFDEVEASEKYIEDENISLYVAIFIKTFKYIIAQYNRDMKIDNKLPKLKLRIMDDGGVLIHWNYKSLRIGFAFEKNLEDSSYYIVADNQITGSYFTKSSFLDMNNIESIIKELLEFVLENT